MQRNLWNNEVKYKIRFYQNARGKIAYQQIVAIFQFAAHKNYPFYINFTI